jgi:hypothetical protein
VQDGRVASLVEPDLRRILAFCAEAPVERVFLEDIARRGLGRFNAVERPDGGLAALCHAGANVVPSGEGCAAFGALTVAGRTRMILGEEEAVADLWEPIRGQMPRPRDDRPGQPVYVLDDEALARLPERGDHEQSTFPELSEEGKLFGFRHEGLWITVNTPKDLRRAEEFIAANPEWRQA